VLSFSFSAQSPNPPFHQRVKCIISGLFESVGAVVFQSIFHAKMHQNDIFSFFKKLFLRSEYQNDPKH
jgi:hypothetical protein